MLRVAGAATLLALGLRAWYGAWKGGDAVEAPAPGRHSFRGAFVEGLLVQLANPKAAVFVFAFYPQFVPQDGPVLAWTAALAGLQVIVEIGLYLGFAAAVGRASGWFRRPRIRRRLDAVSGTVLVGPGVRVAVDPR